MVLSILDQSYGFLTANGNRIDCTREKHCIPERKDRKRVRKLSSINLHRPLTLYYRDDAHFCTRCRHNVIKYIFHVTKLLKNNEQTTNHDKMSQSCPQITYIYNMVNLYAKGISDKKLISIW